MRQQVQFQVILGFIILALTGCFIPWVISPPSSLQMGAHELAEWTSLTPVARQSAPFLWSALILRLPLALIGIIVGLHIASKKPILGTFSLVFAAISMLPPLEFFTVYRDDNNYRQQFMIAVGMIIIGIFPIMQKSRNWQNWLLVIFSILGCIITVIGVIQGRWLMMSYHLSAEIGLGGFIVVMGLAGVATLSIRKQSRT